MQTKENTVVWGILYLGPHIKARVPNCPCNVPHNGTKFYILPHHILVPVVGVGITHISDISNQNFAPCVLMFYRVGPKTQFSCSPSFLVPVLSMNESLNEVPEDTILQRQIQQFQTVCISIPSWSLSSIWVTPSSLYCQTGLPVVSIVLKKTFARIREPGGNPILCSPIINDSWHD